MCTHATGSGGHGYYDQEWSYECKLQWSKATTMPKWVGRVDQTGIMEAIRTALTEALNILINLIRVDMYTSIIWRYVQPSGEMGYLREKIYERNCILRLLPREVINLSTDTRIWNLVWYMGFKITLPSRHAMVFFVSSMQFFTLTVVPRWTVALIWYFLRLT